MSTPNLALNLPNFDSSPWHDDVNANFSVIDAVIAATFGLTNIKGLYKNSTSVTAAEIYADSVSGSLFRVVTSHVTGASPLTFAQERAATPANWEAISVIEAIQAAIDAKAWAANAENAVVADGLFSSLHYAAKATTQAGIATTQAGFATARVGLATTQAGNAAASASTALGYLNAFEGSYIGQYADDAAADASGKTIVDGVFYFKTNATAGLRVYNSEWSAAVFDTTGTLMAANDLSDLTSAENARNSLGLRWLTKSTTYTASSGEKIAADVTAGAWTLTLPPSPSSGDVVMVSVIDGDAKTNNLTIDGNGNNIYGDTTLIYDVPLSTVWLVYNNTEWRLA
jgi:hypothetical protein